MHIDNVIFLILSKNAYTKFSEGPIKRVLWMIIFVFSVSILSRRNYRMSSMYIAGMNLSKPS